MHIQELLKKHPALKKASELQEQLWLNPNFGLCRESECSPSAEEIAEASARLDRFAPLLAALFPELGEAGGKIESELREIEAMHNELQKEFQLQFGGRLFLKMDSHLPIAGSVKARGGIYEVLKHAETLAFDSGLLKPGDNYVKLAACEICDFFSRHTIQVGSTGNLALGIGLAGAKLGFRVTAHMSGDAKQWKKDLLRSNGVEVVEYLSDYSFAVQEGRRKSLMEPNSHFVDDENSKTLFLGYAVAGQRLKEQLEEKDIRVGSENPLFVYLPCGVGGAPGGIAFGLKKAFGQDVHCFFAEPVKSCCMLVGMASGLNSEICTADLGIDGKTEADGLAVGRPSAFAGEVMRPLLSGIYTADDSRLFDFLRLLKKTQELFIEPSACAAFAGLCGIDRTVLAEYIGRHRIKEENITHIAWATGGSMVPDALREEYLKYGQTPDNS